ncbi:Protein XRP2 [Sarcoptes scabiei]|nr:Protein XRP2 [Sarcoptes scabiei]
MGCLMPKIFSDNRRKRLTETEPQKTYSWSNRDRSQASKFIIENQSKSLLLRSPGEINGEQFIIQNCFDSIICLFDYSNTVTIDDCRDCVFFIGPVMGSVVLRNCQDCKLSSASQQFRCRDCKRLKLYLSCATQPAIESCTAMLFSCFVANYNGLKELFLKANLKIFNNKWFNVYDFSIGDQEKNWSIDTSTKIDQCFDSLPKTFIEGLTFDPLHSLIPRTYGIASLNDLKFSNQNEDGQQNCIILVYCYSKDSSRIDDQVYRLIKEIKLNIEQSKLLATKLITNHLINSINAIVRDNDFKLQIQGSDGSMIVPNHLIVLLYDGHLIIEELSEICRNFLDADIKSKILLQNYNEKIFNDCLALIFEN